MSRIEDSSVLIDLMTIPPALDEVLIEELNKIVTN